MKQRRVRRAHILVAGAFAAVGLTALPVFDFPANPLNLTRWKRAWQLALEYDYPWVRPSIEWETAPAADHGFDESQLRAWRDDLATRRTDALLVVKDGRIVHEWYARGVNPNRRLSTAALAKATTGSMALMLAVDAGWMRVDDPVTRFLPEWAGQPHKSAIRIRHLASHSSGIEEVDFAAGSRGGLEGWQREYYQSEHARFDLALSQAPLDFEPGTEYSYSGTGFYVLATALGAVLRETPTPNARAFLEQRLMRPLGIPDSAWTIGYGLMTPRDGANLIAIGSGAAYTARAVARVGQLMLNRGAWNGRQILTAAAVDSILRRDRPPPPNRVSEQPEPPAALGWWTNQNGFWASLPRSAFVGAGANHQVLLVVPELDLVMVRLGASLTGTHWDGMYWRELEEYLFAPLMEALGNGA